MNSLLARTPSTLGIRIPRSGFKAAGSAYADAMKEGGSLVSAQGVAPWMIESIGEAADEVIFSGPAFEGESLDSPCGPEEGLSRLGLVATALARLAKEGRLPSSLCSTGLLVSPKGEILLLPPSIVARAFPFLDEEIRAAAVAALASPRGGGSEAEASFFLAQAAYRIASGLCAFAPALSDRRSPQAGERFIPLSLIAPRLDPSLAALVDHALNDPRQVGLGEWLAAFERTRSSGLFREISPTEAEELEKKRLAYETALQRSRRRTAFLKKRGGLLIGVAVVLGLVAAIGGSIAQAEASKPNYSTYEPRRIIETYYAAVDSLDIDSLEACTEKSARLDSTYVMNLTVITKTRLAYEGKSPVVVASKWLEAKSPALPPEAFLYGVTGLAVVAESASAATGASETANGSAELVFTARYSLWTMDRSGEAAAPQELRRIDSLKLAKGKKGWKIAAIERHEQ